MLLKNKAPSSKPRGETTKSQKPSPIALRRNALKKSNLTTNGSVNNSFPAVFRKKILKVSEKGNVNNIESDNDKIILSAAVKIEGNEENDPVDGKQTMIGVDKHKWDIINLSTTDSLSEPGIYYKQEPLIKTFSDALSNSIHVDSLTTVSDRDSTTKNLNGSLDKKSTKRKSDNNLSVLTKVSKVSKLKTKNDEPSSNSRLHTNKNEPNTVSQAKQNTAIQNKSNNDNVETNNTDTCKSVRYTLGSVVWAKAPGYCWWPAIVDDDPDINMFYWIEGDSNMITHYHVTFLDDEVSRCWVVPKNIQVFFPDPNMKSMHIKKCKKSHLKMMLKAIETAEKCLDLGPQARLNQYSFTVRFTGKSNVWARADVKKPRKSKVANKFEALDFEASILEVKSNVLVSNNTKTTDIGEKSDDKPKATKEKKRSTKSKLPKKNDAEKE